MIPGAAARVGIAGLGRMGTAMAGRLRACGHEVTGWNRSARCESAKGVRSVGRPCDLAAVSDIVLSSLFDDQAVQDVYLGDDGLFSVDAPGMLFVETSTVSPALARPLADAAARRGAVFIDAPVLGTVEPAASGRLILLAGGEAPAVQRAAGALGALLRTHHHVGPIGSGYATKLAVNLVMGGYWAVLGGAIALASEHGVDRGRLLDVIADSPAALAQLEAKRPLLDGRDDAVGFTIAGYGKDVATALNALSRPSPAAEGVAAAVRDACLDGWGERDVAIVALHAAAVTGKGSA